MIFSHAFVGATTTYLVLKNFKTKLTHTQQNLVWIVGITSAILPDFDIIFLFFNKLLEHRKLITHSIVMYSVIFFCIFFLSFLSRRYAKYIRLLSLVFILGVISHFVLDYFVGGLILFAPFYNYIVGFTIPFDTKAPQWSLGYFQSRYMIYELMVSAAYFYVIKHTKNKLATVVPLIWFIVAIILSIWFLFR